MITILLLGYGKVGKEFRNLLNERRSVIPSLLNVKIVGIITRRGLMLGDKEEFVPNKQIDPLQAIEDLHPDIIVDAMSPNYENGEPSLSIYLKAINYGINIITANKAPLALKFREIMNMARSKGVKVLYQATVMSGTPSINLLRVLKGVRIEKIRGILNGTSNYILTLVNMGKSFREALQEAQQKGYAEPDPTLDINGFDSAAKLVILANTAFNKSLTIKDIKIDGILESELKKYRGKIKLIAYADKYENWVRLMELNEGDPLYNVDYVENALEITTDIQNVIIRGPGAGPRNAALGLLSDLLLLLNSIEFVLL
jgi:homoserine dehydrogenase